MKTEWKCIYLNKNTQKCSIAFKPPWISTFISDTTLIYSSEPKISRCYHSDILHFIKSALVGFFFSLNVHSIFQKESRFCGFSFNLRLFSSTLTDVRRLHRALRANPAEFSQSLTGALESYCASSPSLPFCYFSPLRKHGNSRRRQPVR